MNLTNLRDLFGSAGLPCITDEEKRILGNEISFLSKKTTKSKFSLVAKIKIKLENDDLISYLVQERNQEFPHKCKHKYHFCTNKSLTLKGLKLDEHKENKVDEEEEEEREKEELSETEMKLTKTLQKLKALINITPKKFMKVTNSHNFELIHKRDSYSALEAQSCDQYVHWDDFDFSLNEENEKKFDENVEPSINSFRKLDDEEVTWSISKVGKALVSFNSVEFEGLNFVFDVSSGYFSTFYLGPSLA